jgi:lysozyme
MAVLVLAALLSASAGAATPAKGIDVSHYNGAIDWTQVATASYRFVYTKATEGSTLIDPTYSINRQGAKAFGLRLGAYHFARPAGATDAARIANAITQADFLLTVAQPQPGELPPVLDLETKNGLSAAALQTWTNAWLGEIAARTGVSAVVYTSPNFWKTALGDTSSVAGAGYRLWVAHWTTNAAPLVPGANWGGFGWTFWQWSDCSKVPGFAHCVDGDRFNGADPGTMAIAPYSVGAPSIASPPTIVGTAQTTKTLAGVPGTWAGGKPVTFVYQWQRCDAAGANCLPIVGATSETYVPVTDDVGHALVLGVTAQTASGAAVASSPPTVAVVAGGGSATRPVATSPPTVIGTAQAGQTLTTSVGTWTGAPTSFAYQWRRCDAGGSQCTAVLGAGTSTYTLSPGDIGATVSLVVTATGKVRRRRLLQRRPSSHRHRFRPRCQVPPSRSLGSRARSCRQTEGQRSHGSRARCRSDRRCRSRRRARLSSSRFLPRWRSCRGRSTLFSPARRARTSSASRATATFGVRRLR